MNNYCNGNPGFGAVTGRPQSGRFNQSKRPDAFGGGGYNPYGQGNGGMAYSSFSTPNMSGGNTSGRRLGSFGGGRCSVQSPLAVGGGYSKFNNQWQQQRPGSSSSNTNCNYNPQARLSTPVPVQRGQSRCPPKPRCPSGIVPGAAAPNVLKTNNECSPIMVNIPASQIQNAKNTSFYPNRQEPGGTESNEDLKYIPLKWDDILGQTGLNGLRVSMLPPASGDVSCNPNSNRQLKVSFGGQRGRPEQGETQLKVVSIQPITPGGGPTASSAAAMPQNMTQNNYNINANYGGMPQGQGQQVYGGSMPAPAATMPTMMNMNMNNGNNNCTCPNCRK